MKLLSVQLLFSLILFTLILISSFSLYNRYILFSNIQEEEEENWDLVEGHILHDMQTIDKAHLYFDASYGEAMEQKLRALKNYYDINSDLTTWNFEAIKQQTGMDFFVIDANNIIIYSTNPTSLYLNFNECCENFAALLNERRASDEFYSDGLDNSAVTGELWKYSYISTSDHQYILELGLKVEDLPLFQSFNFFDTIEALKEQYSSIESIQVINNDGFFLQSNNSLRSISDFSLDLQQAYERALTTNKVTEVQESLDDYRVLTSRFIPYEAEVSRGNSTSRIVYFQYSNDDELALRKKNAKQMIILLAFSLFVSCILLAIIMKILLSTIQKATFDPLTKLYNRASYEEYIEKVIKDKRKQPIGLLLMDLDNFKYVNDQYGHKKGDELLLDFSNLLNRVGKNHYAARLGGDEFALILTNVTEESLERYAYFIIEGVLQKQSDEIWDNVTVSVGGAYQTANSTPSSLYLNADDALYQSKNAGKNRYTLYKK